MGQKFSQGRKPNPAADNQRNDSDDDDDIQDEAQADPFIDLEIYLELPGGTQNAKKISVNPNITVNMFKSDLSKLVNIAAKNISIYRHQLPQAEMPDNFTLRQLNVTRRTQLRIRDNSQIYMNPIVPN